MIIISSAWFAFVAWGIRVRMAARSKCDDRMANVASKLDNTTPCVRVYVSAGLARPRATEDQSADNWPKDERRNLDKYK